MGERSGEGETENGNRREEAEEMKVGGRVHRMQGPMDLT